jgi:hypothetical protein
MTGFLLVALSALLAGRGCLPVLSDALPDDDDSGDDDTTGVYLPRIEATVQGAVLNGVHVYEADVTCEQVKDQYQIQAADPLNDANRITLAFTGEPVAGFYSDSFVFSWLVGDWSVDAGPDGLNCFLEVLSAGEPISGRFGCAEMSATATGQEEELQMTDGGFLCPLI